MSVLSFVTCFNNRNTYAESSRSDWAASVKLYIQVYSSGVNNFRVDCTTVWSKKGRRYRISIIKRKPGIIWTTRIWRVSTSLQFEVIEYNLNYITTKWKVEFVFNFNQPWAFRVVMVIQRRVRAFNDSVVRCWCNDLHSIITSGAIYWEKNYSDSVTDSVQQLNQSDCCIYISVPAEF